MSAALATYITLAKNANSDFLTIKIHGILETKNSQRRLHFGHDFAFAKRCAAAYASRRWRGYNFIYFSLIRHAVGRYFRIT